MLNVNGQSICKIASFILPFYYCIENLFYIIYKLLLKFYLLCILVIFTETFIFQLFEHYELAKISLILIFNTFILKHNTEIIYLYVINKIWERRNSIIIT